MDIHACTFSCSRLCIWVHTCARTLTQAHPCILSRARALPLSHAHERKHTNAFSLACSSHLAVSFFLSRSLYISPSPSLALSGARAARVFLRTHARTRTISLVRASARAVSPALFVLPLSLSFSLCLSFCLSLLSVFLPLAVSLARSLLPSFSHTRFFSSARARFLSHSSPRRLFLSYDANVKMKVR